jgi:hypothetical protein
MPLEILHFPLVLFSRRTRFERTQVAASTGAGILLPRVKSVLAGRKFADHRCAPFSLDFLQLARPTSRQVVSPMG